MNPTQSTTTSGKQDVFDKLWNTLKSMRFAIILLLVITLVSILNLFASEFIVSTSERASEAQQVYLQTYGEPRASLLTLFQMYTPYRSWWYTSLLGLLTLSLLICVIDRAPIVWRKITKPLFISNTENFAEFHLNIQLDGSMSLVDSFYQKLRKSGYRIREQEVEGVKFVHAGKNLIIHLGPWIIHLGFILLIIGGAMIARGELKMEARGLPGELLALDETLWGFNLRVDNFQVEYYPLRQGQIVQVDGGAIIGRIVKEHNNGTFDLEQYRPQNGFLTGVEAPRISNRIDSRLGGNRIDQANISDYIATLTVIENEKEVLTKRVEVNHPLRYRGYRFYQSSFDDRHVDSEGRWTTIIEVRKDKGSTLVWSGIIIVTLGLILGLYFSPREIFARIEKRDDKVQIQLASKTTRNPTLLTRHFKEIVNEIKIYSKDR